LGGRFDAVTAARAQIAVITPIDYDHQSILGDTLAEIAAEKAAIIRADSAAVVVAPQEDEAANVIDKFCSDKRVRAVSGFSTDLLEFGAALGEEGKFRGSFETAKGSYQNVCLGLAGRHQIENAGTAILTAELLSEYFTISSGNIIAGLAKAQHKGRLEFRGNVLFDGAHNAAGAKALGAFLEEFIGPVILVFGVMKDKDLSEMTAALFPFAEKLILTHSANERSIETSALRSFADGNRFVIETETVGKALDQAFDWAAPEDIICVTGSLYLVGEAMKLLNNRQVKL
jgi:dihydrofolate synthase/folylpolyglutamate synthase